MNLMPDLTDEEIEWSSEHGCIHGLYPDEDPIFCPNCKPDMTDLCKLLAKRREEIETQRQDI